MVAKTFGATYSKDHSRFMNTEYWHRMLHCI